MIEILKQRRSSFRYLRVAATDTTFMTGCWVVGRSAVTVCLPLILTLSQNPQTFALKYSTQSTRLVLSPPPKTRHRTRVPNRLSVLSFCVTYHLTVTVSSRLSMRISTGSARFSVSSAWRIASRSRRSARWTHRGWVGRFRRKSGRRLKSSRCCGLCASSSTQCAPTDKR